MDIPNQNERTIEGLKLRALWDAHKQKTGETQDGLCSKIGLNQGDLQKFFKGKSPIPENYLLLFAVEMNFDPSEVRPSIKKKAEMLLNTVRPGGLSVLEHRINQMTEKQIEELETFVSYLEQRDQP